LLLSKITLRNKQKTKEEEIGNVIQRLESVERMCMEEREKREEAERKVESLEREKVAQGERANDKINSVEREPTVKIQENLALSGFLKQEQEYNAQLKTELEAQTQRNGGLSQKNCELEELLNRPRPVIGGGNNLELLQKEQRIQELQNQLEQENERYQDLQSQIDVINETYELERDQNGKFKETIRTLRATCESQKLKYEEKISSLNTVNVSLEDKYMRLAKINRELNEILESQKGASEDAKRQYEEIISSLKKTILSLNDDLAKQAKESQS